MARKTIYISDEDLELLKKYKNEMKLKTDSAAISHLIHSTEESFEEKIAVAVRKELDKNYYQKERLRWSTVTAEQNSIILLDMLNTLFYKFDINACIPVDLTEHVAITQSRDRLKEKIAHFKQKADERKAKGKDF